MTSMYILTELDESGDIFAQFGPFTSQDAAMDFADAERGDQGAAEWVVAPLVEPHASPNLHRSRKECLISGWSGSEINPRNPIEVAAQQFRKRSASADPR
jgi:hypothetical protein